MWSLLSDTTTPVRPHRFECTVAARERGDPVMATASQVSSWLLVEVNGPWGRDAIVQSELGPHAPLVWRQAMKRQGIRVLAVRRDLRSHQQHEPRRTDPRPRAGAPSRVSARPSRPDGRSTTSTRSSRPRRRLAAGHELGAGWEPDDSRYVLVCTNGRHDACCATFGRPLVRALRESQWADQVWECSHIGGDRFAGNLVLLPDSLYFGHCDGPEAERVLARPRRGPARAGPLPRSLDVPHARAGGRAVRARRDRPRRARRRAVGRGARGRPAPGHRRRARRSGGLPGDAGAAVGAVTDAADVQGQGRRQRPVVPARRPRRRVGPQAKPAIGRGE